MSEHELNKDDNSSIEGNNEPLSPNSEFSLTEYEQKIENLPKRKWSSKEVPFKSGSET